MVPAAAVIPTPRVCMRDAAVKKSVVCQKEREARPQKRKIEEPMGSIVYKGER